MIFKMGESYGDCTSSYYVYLDKEYTLGEFIDTIFKERPNEWGYINVLNIGKCAYSQGNLKDSEFKPEVLSKNIKSVEGCGGWSMMDYVIYIS